MFKNKKVILGGTVVVALAIVMAGTFAWFTDSDEVVNKMKLANFNVKITEDWVEEDNQNLEPDAEVDKVVKVANNGTAAAVVRVKLDETLRLFESDNDGLKIYWEADPINENDADYESYVEVPNYVFPQDAETATVGKDQAPEDDVVDPEDGDIPAAQASEEEITYYTAITSLKDGDTQCYVAIVNDHKGLVRYNPATAALEYAYYKYAAETIADNDNYFTPVINVTEWTYNEEDGYYYYNTVVESGEVTAPLFETVKVSPELPNTYIGSIYHLTPMMEAVQAKAEAVMGTWGLTEAQLLPTWDFEAL